MVKTTRNACTWLVLGLVLVAANTTAVEARITRIVIDQRQSPAYEGKTFGSIGQYEILTGRAFGELDPKDPHNTIITDIQFAPRNARGMVEYVATFMLVKPMDMAKANGVLWYGVPNRGGRNVGDESLLRRGYIILNSGWQGDLTPRAGFETIIVPIVWFDIFRDGNPTLPSRGTTTQDVALISGIRK